MPDRNSKSRPGKVLCLGTGDGWPCADRNHSSYLYELAGACLLIDCGESVSRSLAARRFDWNRPDAIVLSHTHADHIGGLLMLLQGLWLEGRTRRLRVFLPHHAIAPLQGLLNHAYLFAELFQFSLEFVPLKVGQPIRIGRLKVTPFATSHLDRLRRQFQGRPRVKFEAFGFVLEGARRRVIHSADLGVPADLTPWLQMRTDLLMCELAHFSPAELFTSLRGRPIRRLALIHLPKRLRQRLAPLARLAAKQLPGVKRVFPSDGHELRF